jgi:PleD family two-component response regulator
MKILLIDDSKEDRVLIKKYISKSNIKNKVEITESNKLEDAFCYLKKENFDTILLDLTLPESSGIETVNKMITFLKNINKNIPIIILTGLEDYNLSREVFKLGIKDFLIKDEMYPKEIARSLTFACYSSNLIPKKIVNK